MFANIEIAWLNNSIYVTRLLVEVEKEELGVSVSSTVVLVTSAVTVVMIVVDKGEVIVCWLLVDWLSAVVVGDCVVSSVTINKNAIIRLSITCEPIT